MEVSERLAANLNGQVVMMPKKSQLDAVEEISFLKLKKL
jgi:hypothetical protein